MLENVLTAFGLKEDSISIQPYGNGLINNTWKLISNNREFILQKVNANVFKSPEDIAFNVVVIGTYLKDHWPDYNFVYPVITSNGQYLVYD